MLFSWVLFRADNLTAAKEYFQAMLGIGPSSVVAPLVAATLKANTPWVVVCAALKATMLPLLALTRTLWLPDTSARDRKVETQRN